MSHEANRDYRRIQLSHQRDQVTNRSRHRVLSKMFYSHIQSYAVRSQAYSELVMTYHLAYMVIRARTVVL